MPNYIRNSKDLVGIKVKSREGQKKEAKVGQFVDDMEVFLNNIRQTGKCMKIIDSYGEASGSKLNKTKTVGLVTNRRNLDLDLGIKLTMGPESILGIPVGKNIDRGEYWESIIEKLRKKIAPWRIRDLSYAGKVLILKKHRFITFIIWSRNDSHRRQIHQRGR